MLRYAVLATTVAAVLAGATAPGALATTIHVNTEADAVGVDGHCSLREAISAVNMGQSPFTGAGECPGGLGGDTVLLPAGHFVLSRAGKSENMNATGDLDIFFPESTTIAGAGAGATTIDANGVDRVLHVLNGTVTVRNLKITGGHPADGAPGADVTSNLMNPTGGTGQPGEDGGGILSAADQLTVEDCVIAGNHAGDGGHGGAGLGPNGENGASGTIGFSATGGGGGGGGSGGGIRTSHVLTLIRTVMTGNVAGAGGAGGSGVGGNGGNASSSIAGNGGAGTGGQGSSAGGGGAITAPGGTFVAIDSSTISGNAAGDGGAGGDGQAGHGGNGTSGATAAGVGGNGRGGNGGFGGVGGGLATGGSLTISRSLVSANSAGSGGDGGDGQAGNGGDMATANKAAGHGGNGTAGNAGFGGSGGGIQVVGDPLSIANTTVTGNASGGGGDGGAGTGGDGGDAGNVLVTNGSGGDGTGGEGRPGGDGGGLLTDSGGELRHVTISGNHLGAGGGGGSALGGSAGTGGLSGSGGNATGGSSGSLGRGGAIDALADPSPNGHGELGLASSIIAGNDLPSCYGGGLGDSGLDISYPDLSCVGAHADPLLQPLADNGGPTQTQAIGPASPAFDFVPTNGANCPATDQRGVTRPRVAGCDSGAFEYALVEAATGDATGVSATGATLNGQVVPNGHPASWRFEYGTSVAYGSSTAPQDAGHGVTGVPASAAVGGLAPDTTYHYRLVAASADGNVDGGDRTFTTPAGPSDAAPVILSASLRPKRFSVKRGATFRYRLSEAATVTFAIQRAARRKGWGKARRFRVTSKAGANRRRFSGRIGRSRLKPGRYRATLVARDAAGHASEPKRLRFRIVRG